MKSKLSIFTLTFFLCTAVMAQDMTADQVLDNYFENTGGRDAWKEVEGIKMMASVNQGGMELPIEMVQLKGGKTYTKISVQGQSVMQNVYDGNVLWSTNFQTMKAEKADQETTDNMKLENNDFPDPFLNYNDKGYKVEMVGKETIEGSETFKIKLTKEPKMLDGKKVDDVSYYYFDTENFVPILQETEIKQGPMDGKIQQITMSDYQEVENGLYMPFSLSQGVKDMGSTTITIEAINLNPEVEDKTFAYPEE